FPDGQVGKAYLLSQIDSASRYLAHSYFSRHEEDVDQEHGFQLAIRKYGRPRSYYVDADLRTSHARSRRSAPSCRSGFATPGGATRKRRALSGAGTGRGARRSRTSSLAR